MALLAGTMTKAGALALSLMGIALALPILPAWAFYNVQKYFFRA